MKILVTVHGFLTPSMTFVYNQIKALESNGHNVLVVACKRINAELFPFDNVVVIEEGYGLSVLYSKLLTRSGVSYKLFSRSFIKKFDQVIKGYNPDIIHVHFGNQLIRVYPTLENLLIPVVTTFHGVDASKLLLNRKYKQKLSKIFLKKNTSAIVVSRDMKYRLLKQCDALRDKIFIDYLGVDVEFFCRGNIDKKNVNAKRYLQVSNFVEKKGHEYTIKAFAGYIRYYKDDSSKLILAGEGPLKEQCKDLCLSLGISDRIEFVGLVDKFMVRKLMSNSDYFIHHSITAKDGDMEGLPTVIMEALAMNLPVISTYHAGIPEIIKPGKNGFLTKEKDIIELMHCLYKVRSLERGDFRKDIIKDFNLANNTSKIIRIFENLQRDI
nr:glycosyltransferase [uncultured Carboxylicivirga sp.]